MDDSRWLILDTLNRQLSMDDSRLMTLDGWFLTDDSQQTTLDDDSQWMIVLDGRPSTDNSR